MQPLVVSLRILTVARIQKRKYSTLSGTEGVRQHLMVLRLAALFAKLQVFNPLAVTGGYPEIWKRNKTIFIPKPDKDLPRV
jgi:hypothetical protein